MDALSDILTRLDFRGSLYFTTEFTAPWGIKVPAYPNVVRFHLVTRGQCCVRVDRVNQPAMLGQGDFIIIPHGAEHAISDEIETAPRALDSVLEDAGYDGQGNLIYRMSDRGQETRLICGHFSFDPTTRHPILGELPDYLVSRGEGGQSADWVSGVTGMLEREQFDNRPAREAIINRLTEILFIQAVRDWSDGLAEGAGILRALADPKLARALTAVHRQPERRWTVETMAREAGLSRTVFAERFHDRAGATPLQYVTEWRLERARALLANSEQSVEEIAEAVGYRSSAAFARVFQRHVGQGPGGFRRDALRAQPH